MAPVNVLPMQTASTTKVHTAVSAWADSPETGLHVTMSMNVSTSLQNVMSMQNVKIPSEHTTANVTLDTPGMDTTVPMSTNVT